MKTWAELTDADGRTARLNDTAPAMLDAILELLAWAEQMGGWEADCWRKAEAIAKDLGYTDELDSEDR